jgi:hypothetical protein
LVKIARASPYIYVWLPLPKALAEVPATAEPTHTRTQLILDCVRITLFKSLIMQITANATTESSSMAEKALRLAKLNLDRWDESAHTPAG